MRRELEPLLRNHGYTIGAFVQALVAAILAGTCDGRDIPTAVVQILNSINIVPDNNIVTGLFTEPGPLRRPSHRSPWALRLTRTPRTSHPRRELLRMARGLEPISSAGVPPAAWDNSAEAAYYATQTRRPDDERTVRVAHRLLYRSASATRLSLMTATGPWLPAASSTGIEYGSS